MNQQMTLLCKWIGNVKKLVLCWCIDTCKTVCPRYCAINAIPITKAPATKPEMTRVLVIYQTLIDCITEQYILSDSCLTRRQKIPSRVKWNRWYLSIITPTNCQSLLVKKRKSTYRSNPSALWLRSNVPPTNVTSLKLGLESKEPRIRVHVTDRKEGNW